MEKQNYTIATRDDVADCFRPLEGASRGLGYLEAQDIARLYRKHLRIDCVAFNLNAE